ncbi:MAG: hypothetical protein U9P70_03325 [Patescibacteria group bacterium]|nr:hypothetical protein [Patescibacteria group bacterium]
MRIVEDIVRVKKESKSDLPKNYSVVKKTAVSTRSEKKIFTKSVKKARSKIKKTKKAKKTIKLEHLVSTDGRLILGMIVVLFIYIFFMWFFLYDGKKDVPASIENTVAELEKEDELSKKEIDELEEFYSGELLEDTIERIKEMSGSRD